MSKSIEKQIKPVIEKGIPIPSSRKKRKKENTQRINWPFLEMEHGDSFLLPYGCERKKAYSALSALKRRDKIDDDLTLIVRKENEVFRVWLIRKNDDSDIDYQDYE